MSTPLDHGTDALANLNYIQVLKDVQVTKVRKWFYFIIIYIWY
jgi:hypothetical protein